MEQSNPPVSTPAPKRDWWVFSTCIGTGELMLVCDLTGAFGVVEKPTREEWNAAFSAPDNPYRWTDDSRVVLKRERAIGGAA